MREQFEHEVAYKRFYRGAIVAMIFWVIESLVKQPGTIIEMIGNVIPMVNALLDIAMFGSGSVLIIFIICKAYDVYLTDKNERA